MMTCQNTLLTGICSQGFNNSLMLEKVSNPILDQDSELFPFDRRDYRSSVRPGTFVSEGARERTEN